MSEGESSSFTELIAGRGKVVIRADDSELVKGLNQSAKRFREFGEQMRGVGLGIGGAGASLFLPLAGAAGKFAEHGENLALTSQKTGESVEALSAQEYAAKATGTSLEALTKSITIMDVSLGHLRDGSKETVEAFGRLHLSFADLNHLSQEDRLKLVADRLNDITDAGLKAQIIRQIFGRGGMEIEPLLARYTELTDRAKELGLIWSTQDAQSAQAFSESVKDLWAVLGRLTETIGGAVAPALKGITVLIVPLINGFKDWVSVHKELFSIAAVVGLGLVAFGATMVVFGEAMIIAGTAGTAFAGALALVGTALGALVSPIGLAVTAIGVLGLAFLYLTKAGAETRTYLWGAWNGVKSDALEAFDGIKDALSSGDWGLAAQIMWTAIKLEFAKGIASLLPLYESMKKSLTNAWAAGMMYIEESSAATIYALTALWGGFADTFTALWDRITGSVAKAIITVLGPGLGLHTVAQQNEAKRMIDAQISADELQRTRDAQGAQIKREAELKKALADAAKQYADALAQTDNTAAVAADKASAKVTELKKQLDDLRKKADTEAPHKPTGFPTPPELPNVPDLGEVRSRVQGTFSSSNLSQILGNDAGAQIAKNTQETAKNTLTMVQGYTASMNLLRQILSTTGAGGMFS